MPVKKKIEVDFWIGDMVYLLTDDNDQPPAMVTQVILSSNEAMYQVARGLEEKLCYACELKSADATN